MANSHGGIHINKDKRRRGFYRFDRFFFLNSSPPGHGRRQQEPIAERRLDFIDVLCHILKRQLEHNFFYRVSVLLVTNDGPLKIQYCSSRAHLMAVMMMVSCPLAFPVQ